MDLKGLLDSQPDADWKVIEDKGQTFLVDVNQFKMDRIEFGDFATGDMEGSDETKGRRKKS